MLLRALLLSFFSLALIDCTQGACADRCATGCCDVTGTCLNGGLSKACGRGTSCVACAGGESCVSGICTPLEEPDGGACAISCDGCCVGQLCVQAPNQSFTQCGDAGTRCTSCDVGQLCTSGTCRPPSCNTGNCPDGCCDGDRCVATAQQGNDFCGAGGHRCDSCASGTACVTGACTAQCRASSCAGCCQGNTCLPYAQQSATTCAVAGRSCDACPAGAACLSGYCAASCQRFASFTVTSHSVEGVNADLYLYQYSVDPSPGSRLLFQLRTPVTTPKTWVLSQSNYQGPGFTPDLPRLYMFRPCTTASCAGAGVYAAVQGTLTVATQTGSLDAGTVTASATAVRFIPWDSVSSLDSARGCYEFDGITLDQTWP